MLARSAQGLYWIGRYLERSVHVSRMLQTQVSALIDRPVDEIHAGWRLIYASLKSRPPGGILVSEGDDFTLADAFTLAGDLTFERTNPNSIRCCLENGRENARQMRHCISDVMWLNVNHALLDFKTTELSAVWRSKPETFYAASQRQLTTFFGLADISMYRDDAWRFIQLGRYIECTQLDAALLSHYIVLPNRAPELKSSQMRSVLRFFNASEIHDRIHGHRVNEDTALEMLATDCQLPGSLHNHVAAIDRHLTNLPYGYEQQCKHARQSAGRLSDLVAHEWWKTASKHELLNQVEMESRNLHNMIDRCYFNYQAQ